MSFTEIKTQEELDRIINERLGRERESSAKRYEGYLSPEDAAKKYEGYLSPEETEKLKAGYDSQISALNTSLEEANGKIAKTSEDIAAKDKDIADRDARIKKYETDALKTRIAGELGLPVGIADRLRGDKEDDIRKDAQALSKMMPQRAQALMGAAEPVDTERSIKKNAYRKMASALAAS